MRAILLLAAKEIRDAVRNRWIVGATLLLAGLALALAFLGSAPAGQVGASPLAITVVSLASLTIFLVPLIALLLAFDAVVGEAERGTLLLLLTYPVTRTQVLLGKFVGHCAVIGIAAVIGYGGAGLAVGLSAGADRASWIAFAALVGSSVLLGAVFVAIATLVSVLVRERGTAAGAAVGIWLVFVVLYDMALLGVLVGTGGAIGLPAFHALLLANPADVFRLLNLAGFENVRAYSGLAGAGAEGLSPSLLLAALIAWAAAPLALAVALFRRREA